MRKITKRNLCAGLLALLLAVSCLLTPVQSAQAATTGAGNYYLKVNKGTNVVTVYKKDGTPYTAFTCSVGYATPTGTYYTPAKYRWWTLDGPSYGQYCTRITRGFLFHSVWYYQQKENAQSYRQYNKLGTTASHGCVRLTVAASKWIYDNCPLGTKVIIFNGSSKDDPLGKPKTITVDESKYMGWDPTDPAKDNPYKTKDTTPTISISSKTLAYGTKFGNGNMTCKDSGGFDITDWVKMDGTVNMKKLGTYTVTYSVIDSFGRSASKTVTYKVVDKNAATLTGVKASVTRKVGDTYQPMAGVKSKDIAGVDLTKRIVVYIKNPGAANYKKCTAATVKLQQEGKYQLRYEVVNPNSGKKTTKKQTITVIDRGAPILTSDAKWKKLKVTAEERELSWDELTFDVNAKLSGGGDLTESVKVKIVSPSGKKATVADGQSYVFSEAGEYALTYTVTNPKAPKASRTTTHERILVAPKDDSQTEDGSQTGDDSQTTDDSQATDGSQTGDDLQTEADLNE